MCIFIVILSLFLLSVAAVLSFFAAILPFLKVSNPINKLFDISVFLLVKNEGIVSHSIEKQLLLYSLTLNRN